MKLKYVEYRGVEEKENVIANSLADIGSEGIRLYPTQRGVMRKKDLHNCTTLHEYFLRKTNDAPGAIVVDEACMYSDSILGAFLQSLDEGRNILFVQDRYQISNMSRLIKSIRDAGGEIEYNSKKGGAII